MVAKATGKGTLTRTGDDKRKRGACVNCGRLRDIVETLSRRGMCHKCGLMRQLMWNDRAKNTPAAIYTRNEYREWMDSALEDNRHYLQQLQREAEKEGRSRLPNVVDFKALQEGKRREWDAG